MVYETTFRWHIYSAIFVPKITGIGQLLLKLSLVVGWYPFLRYRYSVLSGGYFSRVWRVLVAIGITNQRETTIVWDRETGLPLYNAIGLCIFFFCLFISFYSVRNARIAIAVLAIAIPSVRLSHAGIVSKRRHVARCSLHHWMAKCV